MRPRAIVGLDLTDPYAARPRAIDVALLDARTGAVRFASARWAGPGSLDAVLPRDALVVIDGPQALAHVPNRLRAAERILRAPGRTPSVLPEPRSAPYAGFLRGSVELFAALARTRRLADLGADPDLFEAYPGATWPRLAGGRLPPKVSAAGRAARTAILRARGLRLPRAPLTHDRLDAAVCALMGLLAARAPARTALVGEPVFRDDAGALREGRILVPN